MVVMSTNLSTVFQLWINHCTATLMYIMLMYELVSVIGTALGKGHHNAGDTAVGGDAL